MTQYILHISDYTGTVSGARHSRGRVEGPHPKPCHGTRTTFHGEDGSLQGKTTCDEGHEIPDKVTWDVEKAWTRGQYDRWVAGGFEDDGPQQFLSREEVIDRAMIMFLDGYHVPWAEVVPPAEEGDELWYGWVNPGGPEWDDITGDDGWGKMIARKHTG